MIDVSGRLPRRFAFSAVVTPLVLSAVDVLLVPVTHLSAGEAVALLALSCSAHVKLLAPLLALQAMFVLAGLIATTKPRWGLAVSCVAALALAFRSYRILVEYPSFAGYPPFIVAWSTLAIFLVVAYCAAIADRPRRSRFAIGAVGVLAAICAAVANFELYPGEYPTFHRALYSVVYLSAQGGLLLLTIWIPVRARARQWLSLLAGALFVGCSVFLAREASASAISLYRTFTILGQSEIVDMGPIADECERMPQPMDESSAFTLFQRHDRMPALPGSFRVTDYNVLLITIETTRYDETSLAGGNDATPNLARIVADGAFSFADLMAPSSGTFESLSALFALGHPSFSPIVTNVPAWSGGLRDVADTIAESFRDSGYATFAVLHALVPRITYGLEQGFEEIHHAEQRDESIDADARAADKVIAVLDRYQASGKPFFGWIFFVSPHSPYYERHAPTRSDRERYRQEIANADEQLGRVYDHLRATGLLERTILIVLGDHGEEFGDHGGSHHKATLYNEVLHVPAVVALPGIHGSTISDVTSALYIFPWLMLSGSGSMRDTAKRSIVDDLAPMLEATDGAVVAELIGWDRMKAALIWDDHKLVYDLFSGRTEIFDRPRDPREQHNLADTPSRLRSDLVFKLAAYRGLRACKQRAEVSRDRFPGQR